MSQSFGILDVTFKAGEDLTTHQYKFVYLSADQTVSLCTTSHLDAIGVLQNEPDSDEAAVVRVLGLSKVIASATVAIGKRVVSNTSALATAEASADATEQRILGIAVEAASTSDIFEILLIQGSLVKGTA